MLPRCNFPSIDILERTGIYIQNLTKRLLSKNHQIKFLSSLLNYQFIDYLFEGNKKLNLHLRL